ncbi:hypothetical protein [Fischerella thermalis]|nr:hypothetical protein [Fischerella thermalis]
MLCQWLMVNGQWSMVNSHFIIYSPHTPPLREALRVLYLEADERVYAR